MKITLIFLGRCQPKATEAAVLEYLGRLQKAGPFDCLNLKDEKIDKRAPAQILNAEGSRILAALLPNDYVIACDEHGTQIRTAQLAQELESALSGNGKFAGKGRMVIVIGGALGLSPEVKKRADACWCLSGLTLAGSVARIVLLEGLYRATTILKGHPYHNA